MPSDTAAVAEALREVRDQLRATEIAHTRTATELRGARDELERLRPLGERLARLEERIGRCEEHRGDLGAIEARLRAVEVRPQDSAELEGRVVALESGPVDAPEVIARITALEARADTARFGWGQVVAWVGAALSLAGVVVALGTWAWGLLAAAKK